MITHKYIANNNKLEFQLNVSIAIIRLNYKLTLK